jgi:sec-independent protein translocase protein TatA
MFTTAVGMPGPLELIVVLAIVLILFGAGKLPKVLGQMGKGVKAFKEGLNNKGDDEELFDVTPGDDEAQAPKAIDEASEAAVAENGDDAEDAEEVMTKDESA